VGIAVFLAGVGIALVFEGAERGDDACARVGGLDDGVDVARSAATKGLAKRSRNSAIFSWRSFFALGVGELWSSSRLLTDIHSALGAHDGDFGGGPGEIGIRSKCVFESHDAIRAAVGLAGE